MKIINNSNFSKEIKMNWKNKRINAINKVISNSPTKAKQDVCEYYLDEYYRIINSKANNKSEYRRENQ